MNSLPNGLTELQNNLASASDQQVMRVVGVVEGLPERGDLDGLIATVRPRLARLRPARRVTFVRLMFAPLDALIVPRGQWQPMEVSVPRSALTPLATLARRELGEACARMDEAVARAEYEAGPAIWPRIAAALAHAAVPPAWEAESGVAASDYAWLRDLTVNGLRFAGRAVALYDREGKVYAWLDPDTMQILSRQGEHVAFIDGRNIYDWTGRQIAWWRNGCVRDDEGAAAVCVAGTRGIGLESTQLETGVVPRMGGQAPNKPVKDRPDMPPPAVATWARTMPF